MNKVIINGKKISVGQNVSISSRNGSIVINGNIVGSNYSGTVKLAFEGNVTIDTVDADGSVQCGNVNGDVNAGGSINCENVQGNVSAGGSATAEKVTGRLSAGGSISVNNAEKNAASFCPRCGKSL